MARVAIGPMGDADARDLAGWRYPGVYAFYDTNDDPEDLAELIDPDRRRGRYFSATVPGHGLVGFVEVKPAGAGTVEIGLGLRPELTGRALGLAFVTRLCEWVLEREPGTAITLLVADWNARALTVYERAGFVRTGAVDRDSHGTPTRFITMALPTT